MAISRQDLDRHELQAALRLHQSGDLARAKTLYHKIIKRSADNPDAHYLLGALSAQLGDMKAAADLFGRAGRINPQYVDAHYNRGAALSALGRHEESIASYRRVLQLNANHPGALQNLVASLLALRRFEDALAACDSALRLRPTAPFYDSRAVALSELHRCREAMESHDRAVALDPDSAAAHYNRGRTQSALKRYEDACKSFDRAIEIEPRDATARLNRGVALARLHRREDALQSHDEAIALDPNYAEAYNNRGAALRDLDRREEALRSYDRALELNPDYAEAHANRGLVLVDLERFEEALQSYDRAIALGPGYAEAHFGRGLLLLLLGRLDAGWPEYEWRKRLPDPLGWCDSPLPAWDGCASLSDKTLLIHGEQGRGDAIQAFRFAPLAERRGAKVLVAVQPDLIRLLRSMQAPVELVDATAPPPRHDFHCALMSLPMAFGVTLATLPAQVAYLRAQDDRVVQWRRRIGDEGFKIGVAWQGARNAADVGRSFPLRALRAIALTPGVRLVSLQKYEGVEQLSGLPDDMRVESLGDGFDSGPDAFLDCAAAMACLDLIITSDTAVAHLAGALARPAWVALKRVPDWRWLLDRADSPWYPTLRLFRQKTPGDWSGVFEEMRRALIAQLGSR